MINDVAVKPARRSSGKYIGLLTLGPAMNWHHCFVQDGLYGRGRGFVNMKLGYSTYQWGGRQSRYQPTNRRNMTKTFDKSFTTTIRTTLYSGCKNCLWHHPVSPFLLSKLISHVGSRPVGHRTKKPLFPSPLLSCLKTKKQRRQQDSLVR